MSRRARPKRAIFAVPTVIGVLSLFGLIAALNGDGIGDWISWATLAVPVAAVGWAMKERRT